MPVTAPQLAGVSLFASLDEQELAETASWFEERSIAEGVNLVGEGASGYCFFVIDEGNAVVTANGTELATSAPATSSVRSRSSATAAAARP